MTLSKATLIAGFLALGASPALAWGDMYTGDGTTRAGQNLVFPYPGVANYCPAGLQPVLANGEICCGKPNTTAAYHNAPGKRHVVRQRSHAPKSYAPKAYAPEGYKGVIYK
ncbi:hypothetical protein [Marinovum sp.]|uniref:hypothetical protein n=1 Tax=Marinovum sp. TaxID=2024839 RepID=UPI002B272752|nr:hypothetical protein [Marinovum sp.]